MRFISARRCAFLAALATVAMLALASSASASAGWNDGPFKESTITNCASIIFGNPYLENGTATYVGQYLDPASPPHIGDLYYVHVVVYGVGNPCAGTYADVQLQLPAGTVPYTPSYIGSGSQAYPVKCYLIHPPDSSHPNGYTSQDTSSDCRQDPQPSQYGYSLDPPAGSFGTNSPPFFPIPQGGGVEIQVPVISTKAVTSTGLGAVVQLADGNSNPTLNPNALIQVNDRTPEVDYPTGAQGTSGSAVPTVGTNSALVQGVVFNFYRSGTIYQQIGVSGAPQTYSATTSGDPIDGSTYGIQDYQPWVGLQPGCTYNWRIYFVPAQGQGPTVFGSNQTFHTSGSGGNCAASSPSTSSTVPSPPAINVPNIGGGAPPATPAPVNTTGLPPMTANPTPPPGGNTAPGGTTPGGNGTPTVPQNSPAPPVAFKSLSVAHNQKGSVVAKLNVTIPNSTVELDGYAPASKTRKTLGRVFFKVNGKQVLLAKVVKKHAKAGKLTLRAKLTSAGRKALKKHRHLAATVTLKVKPPGAPVQTATRKITLSR